MIFIAFGSNLPGDYDSPRALLLDALRVLGARPDIHVLKISSFYKTAPVPVSDQPWFYNGVVSVETVLSPRDLLSVLHEVEQQFGRTRSVRNAARVLDLDVIAYHDLVLEEDGLVLPHPRLHERGFVLFPLRDVAPEDWKHPVNGEGILNLVEALPEDQNLSQQSSSILEDGHV